MSKPGRTDPIPAEMLAGHPDARHALTRVWDPLVRVFHWGLVASFLTAWFTPFAAEVVHQVVGYLAAGLILFRLVWGLVGSRYARFSQFLRSPMTVLRYLLAILRGTERRHLGHNPAGGAMVVALILGVAASALTGWMMTTDAYYGVDWVQEAHWLAVHGMLVLIALHLGGVALASLRHRESLVGAMITGRKRVASGDDVG